MSFQTTKSALALSMRTGVTPVLIIAILLWAMGAPAFFQRANAAALTNASDTLTDSDLSVKSGHTINFTIQNALNDASTFRISPLPTLSGRPVSRLCRLAEVAVMNLP
jgi:hypothetical protein